MAKKKEEKTKNSILSNPYLVLRSVIGLSLISFGALVLSPLRGEGDASKFILTILYTMIIVLWFALIGEYIVKTLRLQKEKSVNRYTAIVSGNTILGLVIPIIKINVLTNKVLFSFLGTMAHNGDWWCDFRRALTDYYRFYNVNNVMQSLAFWILVIAVTLFLWGGFIEKMWRKK